MSCLLFLFHNYLLVFICSHIISIKFYFVLYIFFLYISWIIQFFAMTSVFSSFLGFLFCFEICNLETQVFSMRYFFFNCSSLFIFRKFSYEGKYSEQSYSASATGAAGNRQGSGLSGSGGRPTTRGRTHSESTHSQLRTTETFLTWKRQGVARSVPSLKARMSTNQVCREPGGLVSGRSRGQGRNHLNR